MDATVLPELDLEGEPARRAPFGKWQTITFVAGLRHNKIVAPMVFEGPMTAQMFLAYVEQCLAPTLGRGDTVSLLDDLSTGSTANIQHLLSGPSSAAVRFTEGSVLDHSLVSQLTREVDVIVHLAATVGVELVVKKPLETLLNNVRGTEIVLDVAVQRGTKVLVTSTSEIYGKNAAGALHEESDRILGSLLKARWAYATSKEVDEIFAFEYWRQRKLPTVVARLFNCVGPRQTGAYGMVVPRFVRQALTGEDLTVFGDGTQSRRSACLQLIEGDDPQI